MTQQEFIDKFRHEIGGMVLDGATGARTGAELGLFCRMILKKVDNKLVEMYGAMTAGKPIVQPRANGTTPNREQPQKSNA